MTGRPSTWEKKKKDTSYNTCFAKVIGYFSSFYSQDTIGGDTVVRTVQVMLIAIMCHLTLIIC